MLHGAARFVIKKNTDSKSTAEILRQKAEELLKQKSEAKILELIEELAFQNEENAKWAAESVLANHKSLQLSHELEEFQIELKMQNDELKQSEQRYRALVEWSPYAALVHRDMKIVYVNPAAFKLFGATSERDLIGTPFMRWHHPDYHQIVQERIRRAVEEGLASPKIELKYFKCDGTVMDLEVQGMPIIYDGLPAVLSTFNDVTERRRFEHQLGERLKEIQTLYYLSQLSERQDLSLNALYGELIDFLPKGWQYPEIACSRMVVDGVEFCSINFEDSAWKLTAPLVVNHIVKGWIEVAYLREMPREDEGPFLKEERALIDAIAQQLGKITEQKNAEDETARQSTLINSLLDSIPDLIYIKDLEGIYLACNPAFIALFGLPKSEIIGKNDYDFFDKEIAESFRQYDLEMLRSKLPTHNEEWVTYPDGRRVVLDTCKTPYWDFDGTLIGVLGISRDITARKEIEDELKQSLNRFDALSRHSKVFHWEVDANGLYTYVSDPIKDILGYEPDAVIGKKHFYDLHSREGREAFKAGALEAFALKLPFNDIESKTEAIDGQVLWMSTNGIPIVTSEGILTGYRGSDTSITRRKAVEAALQQNEAKLRAITDSVFEAILLMDDQGRIVFWNPAATQIFGFTDDEALGQNLHSLIVPQHYHEAHNMAFPLFQRTGKGPAIGKKIEMTAIRKNGQEFPVELSLSSIHINGTWHAVGLIKDITASKRAEDELKLISTRLSLATVAGGIGIWDYDVVNNTLLWDDQMYALYGIKKGDFGGVYEAWLSAVHPDDLVRGGEEVQMAIGGKKDFNTEFRVIWPDGTIRYVRALAIVQRDESGKALRMLGTNWDITAQKESEVELLFAKSEAETANKSKSIFLANMSHEIRTPLNAIIGFSQLLNREKSLTDSQKGYATSINTAGEHLLKLISDILELSKLEAGRVELKPTNFDLHAVLKEVQMMFRELAQSKQLQLIVEASDGLPRHVIADDHKLRQILINLVGNAIKFTEHGSIVVRARVEKGNKDTSLLVVEIQDSGPGMSEDELGKLFKQFEQTTAGIKKNSGTGLGLALSRELALLMGGNITVASEVGKGSVFTVCVELKEGKSEGNEVALTKRVICIDNPQKTFRVLVADDNEENRKLVVNFLRLVGFKTNEAVNGADAITKFEQWGPHLVLMDMLMPVMDGYEATRLIKSTEKGQQTPVIAVTANSPEDEKINAITFDIQGFVRKPFRENELFAAIGKALRIEFIYEEESTADAPSKYMNNPSFVEEDVAKLPDEFVLQIRDAVEIADFQLLIELIHKVKIDFPELFRHLIAQASDYNYDYLLQVFAIRKK